MAMSYTWAIRQVIAKSPRNISQIVFLGFSLHIVAVCVVKSAVHNSRNDLWLLLYNLKGLAFMWRAGVTRWCCCIPMASKARMLPGRQWGTCTQELLCEIERRGQKTYPQPSIAKKKRRSDVLIAFMRQTLNSLCRWLQHSMLSKIRWIQCSQEMVQIPRDSSKTKAVLNKIIKLSGTSSNGSQLFLSQGGSAEIFKHWESEILKQHFDTTDTVARKQSCLSVTHDKCLKGIV